MPLYPSHLHVVASGSTISQLVRDFPLFSLGSAATIQPSSQWYNLAHIRLRFNVGKCEFAKIGEVGVPILRRHEALNDPLRVIRAQRPILWGFQINFKSAKQLDRHKRFQ